MHRAIQIGLELEKLGVIMFEEPISPDDYEGYARLCDALDIPVSAGEESCTRFQHGGRPSAPRPTTPDKPGLGVEIDRKALKELMA